MGDSVIDGYIEYVKALESEIAALRAELEDIKARHEAILKELPADEEHCGCAVVMFEEAKRLKAKLEAAEERVKELEEELKREFKRGVEEGRSTQAILEVQGRQRFLDSLQEGGESEGEKVSIAEHAIKCPDKNCCGCLTEKIVGSPVCNECGRAIEMKFAQWTRIKEWWRNFIPFSVWKI